MEKEQSKSKKRILRGKYRKPFVFLGALTVLLLGVLTVAFFLAPRGDSLNTKGYQVVYMTSGQAYFGKLKNTNGTYLMLDTPYTAQDVKPEGAAENVQTSTTLVKISQQQYGPTDTMALRADQVLFWQNLRDDSKVTQAIKNAK